MLRNVSCSAKTVNSPVSGDAQRAVDADEVAQVEFLSQRPPGLADLLLAEVDLDLAGPVTNLEEMNLAHVAPEHDPAGDANR